jgi:hypothetical protein
MAWRTIATVLIIVFAIVLAQIVLAGPMMEIQNSLNETGDYNNEYFDGNDVITSMPGHWFNMGLIGIFGIMTWGIARIARNELNRRRGGL